MGGGLSVGLNVSLGEACSSSDTRMHIEALALPMATRAAEVGTKCLCRSLAMEKEVSQF